MFFASRNCLWFDGIRFNSIRNLFASLRSCLWRHHNHNANNMHDCSFVRSYSDGMNPALHHVSPASHCLWLFTFILILCVAFENFDFCMCPVLPWPQIIFGCYSFSNFDWLFVSDSNTILMAAHAARTLPHRLTITNRIHHHHHQLM